MSFRLRVSGNRNPSKEKKFSSNVDNQQFPSSQQCDDSVLSERSARSDSRGVRSFCGSFTDVLSRSFSSYFSPTTTSTNRMTSQINTAISTTANNSNGYGRSFFEPAARVIRNPKSQVVFETENEVQEIYITGNMATFEKQSQRGTTNPWRKYGALRKLHEIGGFAPPGNTRGGRKNKENFITIKKGTKPPPPPRCAEVTLNRDRKNPGFLGSINLPRNVPAEQLSQAIAWEIKTMMESADPNTMSAIKHQTMEDATVAEHRLI